MNKGGDLFTFPTPALSGSGYGYDLSLYSKAPRVEIWRQM